MANIFDYLKWRGDLTISQAQFNNVDALILSRLSYFPFEGVVIADPLDKVAIGRAAAVFLTLEKPEGEVNMPQDIELLKVLAKSKRFKDMYLSGYINEIDNETQKQFAAIIIDTLDNSHFISYRGTDNTIVGWKEDFNMSFMAPVPAQMHAVRYMEEAAKIIPGHIRAGGHSKGGNLAVYAASFCSAPVQERIVRVYNNDGPGFNASTISEEGYAAVRGRLQTFVPQSSVVGMLLEHEEEYMIIHSTQIGLLQHNIYSWEVTRDDFIYLEKVSNGSRFIDGTLKDWMSGMEPEQREQFIDAMFSIFRDTDAQTLKELTSNWYKNAQHVLRSLSNMDESIKQVVSKTLHSLIKSAKENLHIFKPAFLNSSKTGL